MYLLPCNLHGRINFTHWKSVKKARENNWTAKNCLKNLCQSIIQQWCKNVCVCVCVCARGGFRFSNALFFFRFSIKIKLHLQKNFGHFSFLEPLFLFRFLSNYFDFFCYANICNDIKNFCYNQQLEKDIETFSLKIF